MFKPGQKVICINIDNLFNPKLQLYQIYTIKKISFDCEMVNLEETERFEYFAFRFTDATKYLHDKEFKNKLEDLINE